MDKNDLLTDNIDNSKLREYDGNALKLQELTEFVSFYRVNYIKENGNYKLYSVRLKHRT